MKPADLSIYPGGDLVSKGLEDLSKAIASEESLLVLTARHKLIRMGLDIPEPSDFPRPYEHALYESLERRLSGGAHAAYNALIQRIVSFANAYGDSEAS